MTRHKDLPKVVPGPSPQLKVCCVAKQCVCGENAIVQHFHLAFVKVIRELFVPQTVLRNGLKTAGFVVKFATALGDQVRWAHIA